MFPLQYFLPCVHAWVSSGSHLYLVEFCLTESNPLASFRENNMWRPQRTAGNRHLPSNAWSGQSRIRSTSRRLAAPPYTNARVLPPLPPSPTSRTPYNTSHGPRPLARLTLLWLYPPPHPSARLEVHSIIPSLHAPEPCMDTEGPCTSHACNPPHPPQGHEHSSGPTLSCRPSPPQRSTHKPGESIQRTQPTPPASTPNHPATHRRQVKPQTSQTPSA